MTSRKKIRSPETFGDVATAVADRYGGNVEKAGCYDEIVARLQKVNKSLARGLVERDVEIERLRKRIGQLQGTLVEWRSKE